MKLLQITSSFGIVSSLYFYHVDTIRFYMNTLLTITSFLVHRHNPVRKNIILTIDCTLAKCLALYNYYYGITHNLCIISHLIFITCGTSYILVSQYGYKRLHPIIHLCWHASCLLTIINLNFNKVR